MGPFSQWAPSYFTHPLLTFSFHTHPNYTSYSVAVKPWHYIPSLPITITFNSCEQFMMAHKAHLFSPNDTTIYNLIMASTNPMQQRALGRQIPNFDEDIWVAHRVQIVRWGNYLKFTQNEELKELLLGTGDRELVEANPRGRIWGVGFGAGNAEENRKRWGQNLLGISLMEVRARIRWEKIGREAEDMKRERGS